MIIHSFTILEKELTKYKEFIRTLSSARFKNNPFHMFDHVQICVEMNLEDSNNFSKWCNEQNENIEKPKQSIWKNFLNYVKGENYVKRSNNKYRRY